MRGTGTVKAHLVAAGKYHDIDFARLELLKLLAEHPEIRTSVRSEEHTSELQSLMRISYAVFCLKNNKTKLTTTTIINNTTTTLTQQHTSKAISKQRPSTYLKINT